MSEYVLKLKDFLETTPQHELLEYWGPMLMITIGIIVFFIEAFGGIKAGYGRYNSSYIINIGLNARMAWIFQESPAFLVPFTMILYRGATIYNKYNMLNTNFIVLCYFLIHYFNR
jgi:hypothetical protein